MPSDSRPNPAPAPQQISYVSLVEQHRPLQADLQAVVARVLEHGQFVLGPEVAEFEEAFANLCGTQFAIATHSGTDALVLSLRALGIGAGDEVITAPNSFVTTASSIAMCGARPVLADVNDDYTLDVARVEAAITERTKAILPVHLTGRPAPIEALVELAERHGLAIVEDAAQAVLAASNNRRVGSFGAAGCFSLHPLKTLNACGDGGVITTDDEQLRDRLLTLRNNGLVDRETCTDWVGNSRLDSIQAGMLLVKLPHLASWTDMRRAHAARYRERLATVDQVFIPADREGDYCVYHTFVIQAERRDELRKHLQDHGIGTAIHYPVPIHLQPVARDLGYGPGDFPVCEAQSRRILSLPVHAQLTRDDIDRVADCIGEFYSA